MARSSCSWLFAISPLLVVWGLCVLGVSLGTLAITTSFRQVFPFGAPLWTGTLFLILGISMLTAYRPSEVQLLATSKAQFWFTLIISLLATLECLLAISLFLWYRTILSPALQHCTPDLSSSSSLTTCECNRGFTNIPSLRTTIHRFMLVTPSDCSSLGDTLSVLYWILCGFYGSGVILTLLSASLAAKKLHSSGVCGNSGVYSITPEPTTPIPDVAHHLHSHQHQHQQSKTSPCHQRIHPTGMQPSGGSGINSNTSPCHHPGIGVQIVSPSHHHFHPAALQQSSSPNSSPRHHPMGGGAQIASSPSHRLHQSSMQQPQQQQQTTLLKRHAVSSSQVISSSSARSRPHPPRQRLHSVV